MVPFGQFRSLELRYLTSEQFAWVYIRSTDENSCCVQQKIIGFLLQKYDVYLHENPVEPMHNLKVLMLNKIAPINGIYMFPGADAREINSLFNWQCATVKICTTNLRQYSDH